jgi:tripartite-type tricarboxylate transporter receptor subunit TctC
MKKLFVGSLLIILVISSMSMAVFARKNVYPTKPIQVIVPAGAGGDTDMNARMLGRYLEKELGKPMIIVNVNGAGGTLGSRKVKDSAPDGYTVLFYHPSMLLNKILGLVDYTYTSFENAGVAVMDNTNVFAVHADSPYKNLKDLIAAAKAKPGKIKFATETGAFTHLHVLAFQEAADVRLNCVDVGSAAQKIAALLGKQIDVIGTQYGLIKDHIAAGKFRVLGVLSDKRNPLIPNVQTFKENGVNIAFTKFFFYSFPKGTPKEIVTKFTKAVKKVTANKEYQKDAKNFLVTPTYMAPAAAIKFIKGQETLFEKFKEQITSGKVQKQ